jgi:hypothetical protein
LGEFRPDLIILDDIDETHDSPRAVKKKLATVTSAVFAAGSADATVLFIQNRIHKDSAIAQVADGRAEILLGATVTQEPAVQGLEYERVETPEGPRYRVTGGEATWPDGQGLAVAEKQINEWGLQVFLSESQHEDAPDGGLWNRDRDIDPYRVAHAPDRLQRIVIGVDPSGSIGTEAGIIAAGRGFDGHAYLLADDSLGGTTNEWVAAAITRYHLLAVDVMVVERNFGGDMAEAAFKNADPRVGVKMVTSSRGKLVRAEPVQQLYERGMVHHVGHFPELELEMCRYQPGMISPNRLDAAVFALLNSWPLTILPPV